MSNETKASENSKIPAPSSSLEWGQHPISEEQLAVLGDRVSGPDVLNQETIRGLQPGISGQPLPGMVDLRHEGREQYDMDIDRMVNEGLGGGTVTLHNGLIDETTTDTMTEHSEQED